MQDLHAAADPLRPPGMTETVYDAAGKAYHLEMVDAREYLRSGSYFREPPATAGAASPIPQPMN